MGLNIADRLFIVTGASDGLGRAVAETLLNEGAQVIAAARSEDKLRAFFSGYGENVTMVPGDLREDLTMENIVKSTEDRQLDGIFVNAGGPPAKSIRETSMKDWDEAYQLLLRWKVRLVKQLLPKFEKQNYGRILFSESSSVKQPVENLVLSTSLRLAVAGFSKTLAQEYARKGITSNLIAPGFHETKAVERLFKKRSELSGISLEEAKELSIKGIPVGVMGSPEDFATLAAWLLSPRSSFVTGQVYALDGGAVKGTI